MNADLVEHLRRDGFCCTTCQQPWFDDDHVRALRRDWRKQWRGHLGQLIPYRKWVTEKLPGGRDGTVLCGDDGLLRIYGARHHLDATGLVWPIEVKTFGARLDDATRLTFGAMQQNGRLRDPLVLVLHDGNVPGPLLHWPVTPWYDLPEPLVVASRIVLNGQIVTEPELIDCLTDPRLIGASA